MPLHAGEKPEMRQVQLPHARLLSAHRRRRVRRPTTLPEIIQEMLLPRPSRSAGPVHRFRRGGQHGVEGEGRRRRRAEACPSRHVTSIDADRHGHRRLPTQHQAQGTAAVHHLRQRRRRQEHAHRPAVLRIEDDLRGSARRIEKDTSRYGTTATRSISRCSPTASRTSGSRESRSTWRTDPSRPTSGSSSSPTRPATSSTPNMATGASTADLADHPDRRPPRRAHARRSAHSVHRVAARHQHIVVRDQQDGHRGLRPGRCSSGSGCGLRRLRRRASSCPTSTSCRSRPLEGDGHRRRAEPGTCPGTPARRSCRSWRRSLHARLADRNLEDFRFPVSSVLQPNTLNFLPASPARSPRGIIRRGDEVHVAPLAEEEPRAVASSPSTAKLEEASAAVGQRSRSMMQIDSSRGRHARAAAGNVPKVDHRFDAMVVWMNGEPLVPGKQYPLQADEQGRAGASGACGIASTSTPSTGSRPDA